MATLSVAKFATPEGADQAFGTLEDLQKQNIITVLDAAVVSWTPGRQETEDPPAPQHTRACALTGSFWGMLFGIIVFMPLLGAAIGAAWGARRFARRCRGQR